MSLTPRQQRILRPYGVWVAGWLLDDPDAGIRYAKSSMYSCSGYLVDGAEHVMQTTARGIELRPSWQAPAAEVLPWPAIRRYALSLPAEQRTALHDARVARSHHQAAYPTWAATAASIQACGRMHSEGPITYAMHLYDEQHRTWHETRYLPWRHRGQQLDAALQTLLDQALPLAATDPEPTDLLELLAVLNA